MLEKRITRLFGILGCISPHSQITVYDLAREYEVDTRTIQRDIRALENAKLGVSCYDGKVRISRVGYRKIRSWLLG